MTETTKWGTIQILCPGGTHDDIDCPGGEWTDFMSLPVFYERPAEALDFFRQNDNRRVVRMVLVTHTEDIYTEEVLDI